MSPTEDRRIRRLFATWRWTITATGVTLTVIFGFAAARLEQIAGETRDAAEVNVAQNVRLQDLFDRLTAETEQRTLEACVNAADARDALRSALLGVFDQIDQASIAAGNPAPPLVAALRAGVEANLPPLSCPSGSPIVIPQPSTTVP